MRPLSSPAGRILTLAMALLLVESGAKIRAAIPPTPLVQVLDSQSIRVSWDQAATGFILQESDGPSRGGIWHGIDQAPTIQGAQRDVVLSVPLSIERAFFRLRPRGPLSGLDYLLATQQPTGLWGVHPATSVRDTAAAVQALNLFGTSPSGVAQGASGLASLTARNFDDLARRTSVLALLGQDVSSAGAELLDGQNAEVNNPASVAYPGSGWGLAKGFGSSTLDSALVSAALREGGLDAGLAVGTETVPGGGSSPTHPFRVVSGATGTYLRIHQIAGGTLRFNMTPPGGSAVYQDFGPRTTPINLGPLPSTPGTWTLVVQNLSGTAATYSAEFGFEGPDGFDYFRLSSPLVFLARTQNSDGGWGVSKNADSHLMVTAEVLRCLAKAGTSFVGPQTLASGSAWLLSKQNPDGGFSSVPGPSNLAETLLAVNALKAVQPTIALPAARAWIEAAQGHDGSWGGSPYLTAAAILALANPPTVSPIPGQVVSDPTPFATIALDAYVTDPDHADDEIVWSVTGNSVLGVSIVDRVVTITYPSGVSVSENLVFTATDPDGLRNSTSATFAVSVLPPVDYVLARGTSVTDARRFSGGEALLDQAASFSQVQIGMPPGVIYSYLGIDRPTATEFEISYQISADPAATPGDYTFQVRYELFDGGGNPLGPLTGNQFDFSIRITP